MITPKGGGKESSGQRPAMAAVAPLPKAQAVPCMTREQDEACLAGYKAELNYLLRSLQRLGVATADLEDMAQEVFLILRSLWHGFDRSRDLRPYVFGIAFRVASRYRRKQWREIPTEDFDWGDDSWQPDRLLESNMARACVLMALQEIPLKRRGVLVMHDLDQVPVKEIAASLDLPLFTVYSRLRKARTELADAVERLQSRLPVHAAAPSSTLGRVG